MTSSDDPAAITVTVNLCAKQSAAMKMPSITTVYYPMPLKVAAQVPGLSVVRFILSDDERNPQVEREVLRSRQSRGFPAFHVS